MLNICFILWFNKYPATTLEQKPLPLSVNRRGMLLGSMRCPSSLAAGMLGKGRGSIRPRSFNIRYTVVSVTVKSSSSIIFIDKSLEDNSGCDLAISKILSTSTVGSLFQDCLGPVFFYLIKVLLTNPNLSGILILEHK